MAEVYCNECDCRITGKGKTLFSGLVEHTCPECEAKVLAPMPTRIRVLSVVFAALGVIAMAMKLLKGESPFASSGILVLIILLLVHDWRLRHGR